MLPKFIVLISLAGAGLVAAVGGLTGAWTAAGLGGGAAFVGALAGLLMLRWAVGRKEGTVNGALGAIVGGMLVRMVLLAVGLVLVLRVLDLSAVVFLVSFFLVYLATQILEIVYAHRAGRARHAMAT